MSVKSPDASGVIQSCLQEDGIDATSLAICDPTKIVNAEIVAKQSGTLCGVPIVLQVFQIVDPDSAVTFEKKEGEIVRPGDVVGRIKALGLSLLKAERPALNLLQHLSGVATLTSQYVNAVQGTKAVILDTRKTLPGLRQLQKYAVTVGGGCNHRLGLDDMLLVKENHIRLAGSLQQAVARAQAAAAGRLVEVEATDLQEVEQLLNLGVERIMLDNMNLSDVRQAVTMASGKAKLEASGGIDLTNVGDYASAGVDYISIGKLTHSVSALDLSLLVC